MADDMQHALPDELGLWFTDGKGAITRLDYDLPRAGGGPATWTLTFSDRDRAVCLALLDYATNLVQRRPEG